MSPTLRGPHNGALGAPRARGDEPNTVWIGMPGAPCAPERVGKSHIVCSFLRLCDEVFNAPCACGDELVESRRNTFSRVFPAFVRWSGLLAVYRIHALSAVARHSLGKSRANCLIEGELGCLINHDLPTPSPWIEFTCCRPIQIDPSGYTCGHDTSTSTKRAGPHESEGL